MAVVLVYAFDPVEELLGQTGVLAVNDEFAGRLVAEHRAERIEEFKSDALRFVPGSPAHEAARDALRAMRARAARLGRRPVPKVEG